jgi:flagellin
MGLRIFTNVASLTAQRNLSAVTQRIGERYNRLASGLRIVNASDDPAGLAISERMRARLRSYSSAGRNVADAISLGQTMDGALGSVSELLIRMRELAVQASNGVLSDSDRDVIQTEFDEVRSEIGRLAASTEFNDIDLLNGASANVSIHVGVGASDVVAVDLHDVRTSTLGLDGLSAATQSGAQAALSVLDDAVTAVSTSRGETGASLNRLASISRSIDSARTNLAAAESRIRDVDIARESALLVRDQILQQFAVSVLSQANVQPQLALQLLRNIG